LENCKIKPIKNSFKINGFYLNLEKRVGNIALYSMKLVKEGGPICYEVHKVRKGEVTDFMIKRNKDYANYTHYERLARNNDFGSYGWHYIELEKALIAFPMLR
jgi:hypothetical protein